MFYIVPQNFPEGEQEGIGNLLSPFLTPYEERPPKQRPSPRASGTTPGETATMAAVVDTFVWAIETSNPNWRFAANASPRCVSTGRAGFYMLSREPSRSLSLPFDLVPSVCPHDCPSACALEVERIDGRRIGRVRGAAAQSYTQGVVCAKVARYAERQHHPARLSQPLRRVGEKGVGEAAFAPISWDEALDEIGRVEPRLAQFIEPPRRLGGRDGARIVGIVGSRQVRGEVVGERKGKEDTGAVVPPGRRMVSIGRSQTTDPAQVES